MLYRCVHFPRQRGQNFRPRSDQECVWVCKITRDARQVGFARQVFCRVPSPKRHRPGIGKVRFKKVAVTTSSGVASNPRTSCDTCHHMRHAHDARRLWVAALIGGHTEVVIFLIYPAVTCDGSISFITMSRLLQEEDTHSVAVS